MDAHHNTYCYYKDVSEDEVPNLPKPSKPFSRKKVKTPGQFLTKKMQVI